MMKTLSRYRSFLPVVLAGTLVLAFVSYMSLQVIYQSEGFVAGQTPRFDLGAIFANTWTVHWLSLALWTAILLVAGSQLQRVADEWRRRGELLSKTFDTVADGIYVVDAHGQPTLMNASAERMLGLSRTEIVQRFENPAAGRRFTQLSQALGDVVQTRQPVYSRAQTWRRPDGTSVTLSINAAPLVDIAGEITGQVVSLRDISQRRGAEEALAQERNTLRTLIDNIPDYIYVKDAEGRFMLTNPANVRVLKARSAEETIGKTDHDFFPLEEATQYRAAEQEIIRTGKPLINHDEISLDPAGNTRWTLTTKVPFYDSQGRVAGLVGIGRDITARKQTEDTLSRERNLLHVLIDNLPDLIYVKDTESRFLVVNPAEVRLLGGCSADDLLGKSDLDFFPRELGLKYIGDEQAIIHSGQPLLNHEETTVDPAGNVKWLLTTKVPFYNNDGTVAGLVGLGRDITERKRTEVALRASVATNRALLDAIPDTMLRFSGQGRVVNFKGGRDGDAQLFDPDVIGKELPELFGPETAAALQQSITRALQQRRLQTIEFQLTLGATLHDYEARLVVSAENEVLAILRDITGRKAADRLKNEFISTVSHELRTPLTSIRGSLGLIAGGVSGELPAQTRQLIDIAYKNSERLVRLINDILDVEKIESGKMVFHMQPVDLMGLVAQTLEANRAYAEQYGVRLAWGESAPGVQVMADGDRLIQVLTNLVSNACKFSPRGDAVDVAVTRGPTGVRVSVADHGPGIAEDFRGRVFQKFAQADASDTRKKGGTGLGLSISKAIVEKHGGYMGFDTEMGRGTTFYFELPIWLPPAEPAMPAPGQVQGHILICEDDADVANLLRLMLNQSGFATETALSAAQARQLLAENTYDGMTLDLVLPDQDGISFIREIREQERTRGLPIVVVSARAEAGRAELNGDAFWVIDWIDKPVDQEHLVGAIRRAIAGTAERPLNILHVEDDPDVLQVVSTILRDIAHVDGVTTVADFRQRLAQGKYDLAILDLALPDGHGLELLPLLHNQTPPVPVVIFSAHDVHQETAQSVAATLIKSSTSNEKLLDTIQSLFHRETAARLETAPDAPKQGAR